MKGSQWNCGDVYTKGGSSGQVSSSWCAQECETWGHREGAGHSFKRVSVTRSVLLGSLWLDWLQPSRGSSRLRDQTQVCSIAGEFFTIWATRAALRRVNCAVNRTKIVAKGQSCLEEPVGRNAPKQRIFPAEETALIKAHLFQKMWMKGVIRRCGDMLCV